MTNVSGTAHVGGIGYPVSASVNLPSFTPSAFPDATNTGPAAAGFTSLVPTQGGTINTPPSWMVKQPDGSYLVSGRQFNSPVNCYVPNVTFLGCKWVFGGSNPASSLLFQVRAANTYLKYCELAGLASPTSGRATDCVFVQTTGFWSVDHCNLYNFGNAAVNGGNNGQVVDSYIHDPVYYAGDHTQNIYIWGNNKDFLVDHCTLLNQLSQNSAFSQFQDGAGPIDNVVIQNSLIGGGGYTLYLGNYGKGAITNMVIRNNQFTTRYFPGVGYWGLRAYAPVFNANDGSGNIWTGNTYADGPHAGQSV